MSGILKISTFNPPGIVYGFGTRKLDWEKLRKLYPGYRIKQLQQVHSTRVLEDQGEGDGIFTTHKGELLVIKTADCLPVLLADKEGKAVAALHAGWRGLCRGIIPEALRVLKERGFAPDRFSAALGPSIGPCCYEVGQEVVDCFRKSGLPYLLRGKNLDLPTTARLHLLAMGVAEVHVLPLCTRCHPEIFYSYRRGDREARMLSFIGILDIK